MAKGFQDTSSGAAVLGGSQGGLPAANTTVPDASCHELSGAGSSSTTSSEHAAEEFLRQADSLSHVPGTADCDEPDLMIKELSSHAADDELGFVSESWSSVARQHDKTASLSGSEMTSSSSFSSLPVAHSRNQQRQESREYPVFAETNPFRLSAEKTPVVRVNGSRLRHNAPSTARSRLDHTSSSSCDSQQERRLQQDSDDDEECQYGESEGATASNPSTFSGEVAVLNSSEHFSTQSDSLTTSSSLMCRSPFSLSRASPTPDQTRLEGEQLFLGFVHERIQQDLPDDVLPLAVQQNDEYIDRILSFPGVRNPLWSQTGSELRCMADAFANSHQRKELRAKAEQTSFTEISWERFRNLLEELFAGEAGVTQERILVLFFFLADCVIATLRRHAWHHIRRLLQWSLDYIVQRVCALVQAAGGWTVVFRSSLEYLVLVARISAFVLLGAAAIIYIRKNLR